MPTSIVFNGRTRILPGIYSKTESAIQNPPRVASYGKLLMIDTGSFGAGFGGGAGIKGTLENGKNAIYSISNSKEYESFTKGGLAWLLSKPIFFPDGFASVGASEVKYVRACSTVPAEITMNFGDADSDYDSSVDGGIITIQIRNEGVIGNGLLQSGNLYKGYAGVMRAGQNDSTKFIIDLYIGTYKGEDTDGDPYDGIAKVDAKPILLVSSPEFRTLAELVLWMNKDATFNYYFKLKTHTILGSGVVDALDLSHYSSYTVATGGSEIYSSAMLDEVLDQIVELDYSFALCDNWGDNAMSSNNGKIIAHIVTEAKYEKFMVVGGGKDALKFTQANGSIPIAEYYNSDRVTIVHSGVQIPSNISGTGFKEYDSIYTAAAVVGRILGLPPQVPATFKGLNIKGVIHPLKEKEKELCLIKGVLPIAYDSEVGRFIIVQGINSLQNNDYLVNEDATSFSIQVKRIMAHANKTLTINARKDLFNAENGANRFTMSKQVVKDWAKKQLKSLTVTTTEDNLFLSFRNVEVNSSQDNVFLTYGAVPNGEITKLLITSTMLDS
jgi:hypothetical protein